MDTSELKLLRDKCLFYTQFVIQKLSASPELIKDLEETYRLVEKAYRDKKVRPLKVMSREIDEQVTRHMPLIMAIQFKKSIKKTLKIDYNVIDYIYDRFVQKIIKSQKIANQEEYEIVVNRTDEIFSDPTKVEELKKLSTLLSDYENQNKK